MLYTLIHDLRNSVNERNTSFLNPSFYSRKEAHSLLLVWVIDGETYTQSGDFFLSHIFFREPGGANACIPLQVRQRRSDRLRVSGLTAILSTQSKSDRVVFTWSPSGYTPVRLESPDVLSSSCLLIKMWQLAKAHGVVWHIICYIIKTCHDVGHFDVSTCTDIYIYIYIYIYIH